MIKTEIQNFAVSNKRKQYVKYTRGFEIYQKNNQV